MRSLATFTQLVAERLNQPAVPLRPWREKARPEQLPPPGDWLVWLIMAGRGWGKTFTGAGWLLEEASTHPNTEWGLFAPTFRDCRVIGIEGPAGLLKAALPGDVATYNRSTGEVRLANGSLIHAVSADEPERARGLNLAGAWCEELGSWRYDATWYEGIVPALRIGDRPRLCVTTTPRPTRLIKDLTTRADGSVHVTRGATFDNAANLSATALDELRRRYEGTRLGRQELYGELLEDVDGALFHLPLIDAARVTDHPDLVRLVVAVDPAATGGETADEHGIVAVGADAAGDLYVLGDESRRGSPHQCVAAALEAFDAYEADQIVAEVNQGGDWIASTLHHIRAGVPYVAVRASRGKRTRAEPVAALYEQGRVHHVGAFPLLEDQMCSWTPDDPSARSPDRMDALVWAVTALSGARRGTRMRFVGRAS